MRRDPLLQAVELADLERRSELRVLHGHPGERDVLLEDRAARAARHDADPLPADVDLVAVARGLVPRELEPDQDPLRMRLPLLERRPADEVVVRPQIDGEADSRLEGVDLVVELVAGEDQARLDAQDVERLEAERREAVLSAPASQIASHTAGPSDGWHHTS